MSKPFGEDLWRSVQGVRIDKDGTFRAPVRASSRVGIVVGQDAVERAAAEPSATEPRPGLVRRVWRGLRRT